MLKFLLIRLETNKVATFELRTACSLVYHFVFRIMGDPKKIPRYNERGRSSGCCLNLTLTLCLLSAIASFGVVNYIQFEELWKLKVRVEELENICNNNKVRYMSF